MLCEYCGKEGAEEITIQRVTYELCKSCQNDVPMGSIQAQGHIRAVKDGDIDCQPLCSVCRDHAHDLQDLTHEKT